MLIDQDHIRKVNLFVCFLTVMSMCVDEPCFKDYIDPSLISECTDLGPDNFTCGSCPSGMTGDGVGPQGCQGTTITITLHFMPFIFILPYSC